MSRVGGAQAFDRARAGTVLAVAIVVLFLLGFIGWLVQGAGDDEPVPTVPPTTLPIATVPPPP